jgi:hypothetical protein
MKTGMDVLRIVSSISFAAGSFAAGVSLIGERA